MMSNHTVKSREIGQVRIYMTPGERRPHTGKKLRDLLAGATPLYVEIIRAAKQDGLLNATVHRTHYGFSGGGPIRSDGVEIPNANLTLCVELISSRAQLEIFCRKHSDWLRGKVVVYKHIEHWEFDSDDLHIGEATQEEYADVQTRLASSEEKGVL